MILADIKSYLMRSEQVSETQLASAFQIEISALQGMLQRWLQKGAVLCYRPTPRCGVSCSGCPMSSQIYYKWNKKLPTQPGV